MNYFKMNKLLTVLASILVIVSCNNEKQVKIKGKIDKSAGAKIIFEKNDVYFSRKLDSTLLKSNGKFNFKTDLRSPEFFQLVVDSTKIIPLLLTPGENVTISADLNGIPYNIQVKGSEGSTLLNELNTKLTTTQIKLDSVAFLFEKSSDLEKDNLLKEYQEIMDNHRRYSIGFILKNMGSLSSLSALYQQYNNGYYVFSKVKDLQYFKLVTDSLTKKYSKSKQVIALKENTSSMIANYSNKRILNLVKENDYHVPEIDLPGSRDVNIKLSDYKGKIILLSFWATWETSSIDYNIRLKEIYNKYKNKGFEIYSISLDNSKASWMRAINFDALPWVNVIDTLYPNSQVVSTYNVQALPYNYLIGKDFETILSKNVSPAQLDATLKELLK